MRERVGSDAMSSADESPRRGSSEARLEAELALLRSCAEVLVTSDGIGVVG